jgi:hypothetical protein
VRHVLPNGFDVLQRKSDYDKFNYKLVGVDDDTLCEPTRSVKKRIIKEGRKNGAEAQKFFTEHHFARNTLKKLVILRKKWVSSLLMRNSS